MSVAGIQGLPLEITVVGCLNLKDKEWISRQDPYVSLEYASSKHRTRTCTDGGKNPTFQEKFIVTLIEGLRELNVIVWNSNTLSADDFIGNGRVQLQKVLSQGFDDSSWTIQDKCGRYAGEVRLILHYACANAAANPGKTKMQTPAQPYATPTAPPYQAYPAAPPAYAQPGKSLTPTYPPAPAYPTAPTYPTYPASTATYPAAYPVCTPPPAAPAYPPPPPAGYSACAVPPPAYPPAAYPPQYPPPAHHAPMYPPPPGVYPPPPY